MTISMAEANRKVELFKMIATMRNHVATALHDTAMKDKKIRESFRGILEVTETLDEVYLKLEEMMNTLEADHQVQAEHKYQQDIRDRELEFKERKRKEKEEKKKNKQKEKEKGEDRGQ